MMEAILTFIIKVLNVSLELLEWEINDQTHCEVVSRDATIAIGLKHMELMMPQKFLD